PMNGVIGMTTLLMDSGLTEEQRDYVETIRVSGESLLTIINDILDFSKIEADKIELEEQPFELRQCIEEALDLMASKAAEKRLELAYTLSDGVPEAILGDVTRLRQVLVNLLGNAVKFTETGEVVVYVESRAVRSSGSQTLHELQFSVRDTGIGIPADRLDRLFSSFSQVDSSTTRKYGGTGLGLAISRRLAELMGGTMWVESTVGVGSTFYFTTLVGEASLVEDRSLSGIQPVLEGKRVLIVDDNETNRKILLKQTENWGMAPTAWSSAQQALDWVDRGGTYDFALLDMQMPEMDGMMLAEGLRARDTVKDSPLIMLSSVGSRVRAGGLLDAALTKPVRQAQLFEVLSNAAVTQDRLRHGPDWNPPTEPTSEPSPSQSAEPQKPAEPPQEISRDSHQEVTPAATRLATKPTPSRSVSGQVEEPQSHAKSTLPQPESIGEPKVPQTPVGPPASRQTSGSQTSLRILLAEDNAVNQKVAMGILGRLGYKADVAANGLEVLKALELKTYDVILMDVQMPEMDGLEATRHIRQTIPRERRPRIVAMTANAMQGDRDRCLEAGMDDYIPKPVRHEDLAAALDRSARIAANRRPPASRNTPKTSSAPNPVEAILDRTPTRLDFNTLIGPKNVRAKRKETEKQSESRSETPSTDPTHNVSEPPKPTTDTTTSGTEVVPSKEEAPVEPQIHEAHVSELQESAVTLTEEEIDVAARAIPEHLRQLTGVQDYGFALEVLNSYLRSDEVLLQQIMSAHRQGDAATLGKAVHKLKSSSGILGATRLAERCAELEGHARSNMLSGTNGLLQGVAEDVRTFRVVANRALELIEEQHGETSESETPAA
ncbi:MAG: response regulator, partial [Rubricoccaceae bacterium]|nr:response regulator [Rubricoccaceae bacterium]